MKPSSSRIRAISRLVLDAGTMTSVCLARDAFRMGVTMSAIGSEMFIRDLPARLRDARKLAEQRALPKADAAQNKPPHEGPRPPADRAAVVRLHFVLWCPLCLGDQ